MKLKTQRVSLGLVGFGSSLMAMAIMSPAQAYNLTYLGRSDLVTSWGYNYEFTVNSGESLAADELLSIGNSKTGLNNNVFSSVDSPASSTFTAVSPKDEPSGRIARWAVKKGSTASALTTYQTFVIKISKSIDFVETQVPWTFKQDEGPTPVNAPVAVPEPITIIGSVAALGFGAMCQRELNKKQKESSTKDIG